MKDIVEWCEECRRRKRLKTAWMVEPTVGPRRIGGASSCFRLTVEMGKFHYYFAEDYGLSIIFLCEYQIITDPAHLEMLQLAFPQA